jgi:hypothetical protein
MTSAEFRFLRKQMGLTQKELGERLGVEDQTIANYEKEKTIPLNSDKHMRLVFLLWMAPPSARAEILQGFADAFQRAKKRMRKSATHKGRGTSGQSPKTL